MSRPILLLAILATLSASTSAENAKLAEPKREKVVGGVAFLPEKRTWTRITGHVTVLSASRLAFADGTAVNLQWGMNAPDLAQQGRREGSLYPAGKEAAEFLRVLIGDRAVTFIGHPEGKDEKQMQGPCFVGETSLEIEMIRGGWAISDHEGMDPFEIMARENKRGLWRGEFIPPQRWRKGERLLGEPAAAQKPKEEGNAQPADKPKFAGDSQGGSQPNLLASSLVRAAEGVPTRGPWGEWRRYFRGPTPAMSDLVVLAVTLKPGEEPHPPHRHAEEEIMLLAEGSGVWHLDGKELAAQKGDTIYTGPQTIHGIKNTGSVPLTYYMVKWNGKVAGQQQEEKPAAKEPLRLEKGGVIRDEVKGSINHGKGMAWNRIIGKVRVIDANTIEFADGTRIELDLTVPAPGQMAMNGDRLYACGQEAAEFLRAFIGDKPVMCFKNDRDGPFSGYVGDTNLERLMVVSGWALADHSSLHADEIIARENKRGLWQGKFIHPDTWRSGVRLPGEMPPPKLPNEAAARKLFWVYGEDEDALPSIISRVVSEFPTLRKIHFTQRGRLADDGLAQLAKLDQLEVLDIAGCGEVTNAGLAHLQAFPHLKELHLPHTTSDSGLVHLEKLTELEKLTTDHWRGDPITDAGLAHLKKLRRLKHLVLNGLETTDAGLAILKELPDLAVLEFGRMPVGDAGLVPIGQLRNLEYLDVSGTEVTDAGLPRLVGLQRLRVLKLPDRVTERARRELQQSLPEVKFEGELPK